MRDFRKLDLWHKAYENCLEFYELTGRFSLPKDSFLASQIQRSALSIPLNIAESAGVPRGRWELQKLYIALSESKELDAALEICLGLRLISEKEHAALNEKTVAVSKMLLRYIKFILAAQDVKWNARQIKDSAHPL